MHKLGHSAWREKKGRGILLPVLLSFVYICTWQQWAAPGLKPQLCSAVQHGSFSEVHQMLLWLLKSLQPSQP